MVFTAVSDKALPTVSVIVPPLVVPVVVMVAFDSASVDPLRVKVAVWPAESSFVKAIVPSVIVPMVFVLVV